MKAKELTTAHIGWDVEVDYAKGRLQAVAPRPGRTNDIDILVFVHTENRWLGITVDGDMEVHAEKTLEDQIKDDLGHMKNQALGWLRKKIR